MSKIVNKLKKYKYWQNVVCKDKLNFFQRTKMFFDFGVSAVFLGNHIDEYFKYRLYQKKYSTRRQFILDRQRGIIKKTFNNLDKLYLFDNKIEFNKIFDEFLKRDWFCFDNSTYDDYCNFIDNHKSIFFKPLNGSFGSGIKEIEDLNSLKGIENYNKLKKDNVLLEEKIFQCEEMSRFNASTVNTIRVLTLLDKDNKPRVMAAAFRCGRATECVDNFHRGGLAAKIDIKSGMVVSNAVDCNVNYYKQHPDSGIKFHGYKVPMWDQIIDMCLEAAKQVPDVRYVGWDVALTVNGPAIIEGNCTADPDILQMPTDTGIWYEFKRMM